VHRLAGGKATGQKYCAWDDLQRGSGAQVMPEAMSFVVKYRVGSGH
jgi:hypothetical protein